MPARMKKAPEADANRGLSDAEAGERLRKYGFNEVEEKKENPLFLFLSKFWGLGAWMLEAIMLLSWYLGRQSDLYTVSALLVLNAIISFAEERNASNAVEALKKRLQVNARVLRSGAWRLIPARELVPGDAVRIRIGDFVPADVQITRGEVSADESALTGESLGVEKNEGVALYAGSVITRGECLGTVTLTGASTFFGKTAQLVQSARPKLHSEEIIGRVVRLLFVIVLALLALTFAFSLFRGGNPLDILPLMLVLLLGAIPVALPAMFTVSMAVGSMELSKKGVLVTRLSAPEDAAGMDVLCVDKTGTMTENRLAVAEVFALQGASREEVLLFGALASQEANRDPIDMAFIRAAPKGLAKGFVQKSFSPFDPKTRRTEAEIAQGRRTFTVMKGSVGSICDACGIDAGMRAELEARVGAFAAKGYRTLAVSREKGGRQALAGLVALNDPPRKDSNSFINQLKSLGISVKMLTGDALPIAREIATAIGLDGGSTRLSEARASGSLSEAAEKNSVIAEIYPGDKYEIVKGLQSQGHVVGMTGDGVNDAPALRQAEVGIAVSSATDVAKGSASAVLTQEGLVNILGLVEVGRSIFRRINTWVLNKISRTVLKTGFVVLAFMATGQYAISSSAMLLVIFMTDFVKLSLSTDNVKWSRAPEKWDVDRLAAIGALLGIAMVAEALGLLYIGSVSFGMLADPQSLNTFSFELLLFFAIFSVLSVREKGRFWDSRPSATMSAALGLDLLAGAAIGTFGLLGMKPLPIGQILFVAVYALVFSLGVNDSLKIAIQRALEKETRKAREGN